MKKIIIALIAVLATAANINAQSLTYPVAIDATNFPDQYFRAWVAGTSVDEDADGYLSQTEAEAVTAINSITNYSKVTSYQGIEYFSQLKRFHSGIGANSLTNIDFSKNTALTSIYLSVNTSSFTQTTLDLSNNTALTSLTLRGLGNLSALDLSNNMLLNSLTISNCKKLSSSLNLPNTNSLETISIERNGMHTFDFSGAPRLRTLTIIDDSLTQINLSNNTYLSRLTIGNSTTFAINFKSLDLSSNTMLTYLWLQGNGIEELDLSSNTSLQTLALQNMYGLANLDISQNTNLRGRLIICHGLLTELDCSHLTNVTELKCWDNYLTSLKVPSSLISLECYRNFLTSLDLSQCTELKTLNVDKNALVNDTSIVYPQSSNLNYYTITNEWQYAGAGVQKPLYVTGANRSIINVDIECDDHIDLKHFIRGLYNGAPNGASDTDPFFERDIHFRSNDGRLESPTFYENNASIITLYSGATDFDRLYLSSRGLGITSVSILRYKRDMPTPVGTKSVTIDNIIPSFFSLYINPASVTNNGGMIYTGTLYLPYAVKIPTDGDVKVYVATGITQESEAEGRLVLEEITTGVIPANTAVIVTSTEPGHHIFYHNVSGIHKMVDAYQLAGNLTVHDYYINEDVSETYPSNILRGSWYATENVTPYSILTLGRRTDDGSGKIGFWNYKGNKTGLFRCYVPNELIPSAMMSPKFRGLSFKFPDEEDALTSIDAVPVERATIDARTACYDLQGRQVTNPQRGGVYIVNGKKVIF